MKFWKKLNPKYLQSQAIIKVLKCTECKHSSKAHTRRRPAFVAMEREQLAKLIQETGFPGSMGFQECIFYYCDMCEALACQGHFDGDSCGGLHKDSDSE